MYSDSHARSIIVKQSIRIVTQGLSLSSRVFEQPRNVSQGAAAYSDNDARHLRAKLYI